MVMETSKIFLTFLTNHLYVFKLISCFIHSAFHVVMLICAIENTSRIHCSLEHSKYEMNTYLKFLFSPVNLSHFLY